MGPSPLQSFDWKHCETRGNGSVNTAMRTPPAGGPDGEDLAERDDIGCLGILPFFKPRPAHKVRCSPFVGRDDLGAP